MKLIGKKAFVVEIRIPDGVEELFEECFVVWRLVRVQGIPLH